MFRFALVCLLPMSLSVGCAHAPSESSLAQLQLRLSEAQRKEAEGRKRIDDLENRVFLLTDQLESQKVVAQATHAPRLPVVMLRPNAEDDDHSETRASNARWGEARRASPDEGGRERPPVDDEPEFTGAARSVDSGRVRPVLTGEGMGNGDVAMAPTPHATEPKHHPKSGAPEVRFASHDGSELGVAPVPPIAASIPKATRAPQMQERAPLDQEPLSAYRAAYADVTAGKYDQAEVELRAFVKRFPHHDYADNAQYWLGECFYARQKYREAASEFRAAVAKYPMGNKAPDALLKLAYSLIASGDAGEGRKLLEELPTTYPRSEASHLATQRLAELVTKNKTEELR